MTRRRGTPNHFASQARIQDNRAAQQFRKERIAEGFFADLHRAGRGRFFGLVIAESEYNAILEAEKETVQPMLSPLQAEIALPPTTRVSNQTFLEHPMTREDTTALGALTASYQAYLGSLALDRNEMIFDYEFVFPGRVVQDEGPGFILGVPITPEVAQQHEAAMADIARWDGEDMRLAQ